MNFDGNVLQSPQRGNTTCRKFCRRRRRLQQRQQSQRQRQVAIFILYTVLLLGDSRLKSHQFSLSHSYSSSSAIKSWPPVHANTYYCSIQIRTSDSSVFYHRRRPRRRRATDLTIAARANKSDDQRERGERTITNPLTSTGTSGFEIDTVEEEDYNEGEDDSVETIVDTWEPNDVDRDIALLRCAMARQRANDHYKMRERIALMDAIAAGRRAVLPDLAVRVLPMCLLSLLLASSLRCSGVLGWGGGIARTLITVVDWHYWMISVTLPLSFVLFSNRRPNLLSSSFATIMRRRRTMTAEQDEEKLLTFLTGGSPLPGDASRYNGSHDAPRYMMEHIASSVLPHAAAVLVTTMWLRMCRKIMEPTTRRRAALVGGMRNTGGNGNAMALALLFSAVQLINRIGAAAAACQYPKLLYDVRRNDQARPLTRSIARMRSYLRFFLGMPLELGIACDLGRVMALCWGIRHSLSFSRSSHLSTIMLPRWAWEGAVVSILSPLLHLLAWIRIFRIGRCTNQSFSGITGDEHDMEKFARGTRWRWTLLWRDPPRQVSETVKLYLLLFFAEYYPPSNRLRRRREEEAWLRKRERFSVKDNEKRKEGEGSSPLSPLDRPLLELMVEHSKELRFQRPMLHRSTWPSRSMDRVAARHERSYNDKTFEDPLGIAVYKTLGIGLSFDYDHDTLLKSGEEPSIHRLRARAAKSAVKRMQLLYDPNLARIRLNNVTNPTEKRRVGEQIRREAEEERNRLAKVLSQLIPTYYSSPPEGVDVDVRTVREAVVTPTIRPSPAMTDPNSWVAEEGEAPDPFETAFHVEYGDDADMNDPRFGPRLEPGPKQSSTHDRIVGLDNSVFYDDEGRRKISIDEPRKNADVGLRQSDGDYDKNDRDVEDDFSKLSRRYYGDGQIYDGNEDEDEGEGRAAATYLT